MSALRPGRRKGTAREVAERLGVSPRTVQRLVAEPRDVYDARVTERHERIRELRADGKSYRAIAAALNVSIGTVQYALNKAA